MALKILIMTLRNTKVHLVAGCLYSIIAPIALVYLHTSGIAELTVREFSLAVQRMTEELTGNVTPVTLMIMNGCVSDTAGKPNFKENRYAGNGMPNCIMKADHSAWAA
jgi:hypothetical protein